jgi:branched-chain amino acid transport system permease protein
VASLGAIEERVAIRLLRPNDLTGQLITTIGAGVLLDGIATLIWGSNPLQVPFIGSSRPLTLLGGRVLPDGVTLVVVAVGLALLLHLIAHRTKIGLAALAATEDREAATLKGVNIRLLSIGAFTFAGLIAGLVGVVVGPQTYAYVSVDLVLALNGFVALAIGGFGSQLGVLLGGLIVGVVEELCARWVGPNYQDLIVFALLLTVLMIRPTGLFGTRAERVV